MDVADNTTESKRVAADRRTHRSVRYNTCHLLNVHSLTRSWYRHKARDEYMIKPALRKNATLARITIPGLLIEKRKVTGHRHVLSERCASN